MPTQVAIAVGVKHRGAALDRGHVAFVVARPHASDDVDAATIAGCRRKRDGSITSGHVAEDRVIASQHRIVGGDRNERSCGDRRPGRTGGACGASRTGRTRRSRRTLRTGGPDGTRCASRTRRAYGADRADRTGGTLGTRRPNGPNGAGGTDRTGRTCGPAGPMGPAPPVAPVAPAGPVAPIGPAGPKGICCGPVVRRPTQSAIGVPVGRCRSPDRLDRE